MADSSDQSDGLEGSGRTETVKSYVSSETKRDLDREAERQDVSRSSLIAQYIRRGLRQDREDDVAAETRAEQRLQDVLDAGLDDMADVARHQQEITAKSGVYAVAAFELIKQEHGEAAVADALRAGARRLREDDIDDLATVEAEDVDGASDDDQDDSLLDDLRGGDR